MSDLHLQDFNPDFPAVRKRWDAWWQNGLYDRPVVRVLARLDRPREDIPAQTNLGVDATTRWTDESFLVRAMIESLRWTYFGKDALPIASNPISVGHALYFGARPTYVPSTVDTSPAPCAEGAYPSLDGWEQSPYWAMAQRHVAALAAESHGRWLTAPFFGNGAVDTLAAVRGFEQFYMDLATDRGWVIRATQEMSDILRRVHRKLLSLAAPVPSADGYGGILGYYSTQPHMAFDADVSYSLSPRDFAEVILPPLRQAMADFPLRAYHLDGPGALVHLDALLAVPELQAIQWVQGAGGGGALRWLEVIQKIQAAGKAVQIFCGPEEIPELLKRLRPEGLCIYTNAPSESEARRVVDGVAKAFAC